MNDTTGQRVVVITGASQVTAYDVVITDVLQSDFINATVISAQRSDGLPLTAQDPGFVTYQVQVTPQQDAFYQNNRLDTFSQVEGPPRILVVAPPEGEVLPGGEVRPDETSLLLASLTSAGFDVKMIAPNLLPADLPTLAQYNSVVLVDVPARQLDRNQMETLQSYVRDLGGGLVAVGGPTSYGVGGYYGTPLEDALPT